MNAVLFLERQIPKLLSKELLIQSLVVISPNGATFEEINLAEAKIGLNFSNSYRDFLQRWNGLDLDVIRFFGVGKVAQGITKLLESQNIFDSDENFVFIASSPAGFIYAENIYGQIYDFDHDGGEISLICNNFDEFVIDYLFGKNSNEFMGDEWRENVLTLN